MVVSAGSIRHIPTEIVQKILLNLPVKSLLRLSTVSKSWNSIIFDAEFIRRHKSGAALPGRERVLISSLSIFDPLRSASSRSLSSISSNEETDDSAPLICPFKRESVLKHSSVHLLISCEDLWCVRHAGSLFLWNPSMRTYRKLPCPFDMSVGVPFSYASFCDYFCFAVGLDSFVNYLSFGLGYDSVGDDYKILKICSFINYPYLEAAELYSLRSNSWRKIQPFPQRCTPNGNGVFLSGSVHWLAYHPALLEGQLVIVTFDLSTERYTKVARLPFYFGGIIGEDEVKLTVIGGKLCVHANSYRIFVLWVMNEYGVRKSWSKIFEIELCRLAPYIQWRHEGGESITLTPLYFYDNGKILIRVVSVEDGTIFMNIDEQSEPHIVLRLDYGHASGLLYMESLVSPATYCRPPPTGTGTWPTTAAVGRIQPANSVIASIRGFGSFIRDCVSMCFGIN